MSTFKDENGEWIPSSFAGVWALLIGSLVLLLWLLQTAGFLLPDAGKLTWWPTIVITLFCYGVGGQLIRSKEEGIWAAFTSWLPQRGGKPDPD
ncbi:MAG: hypothetical protein AMJ65_15540 [Phycisphaerae bacterium SG8_4]|nr:MAG: hypothetical protein AMJ65_15540 [Phycisphaerae bacterium SG8_4]